MSAADFGIGEPPGSGVARSFVVGVVLVHGTGCTDGTALAGFQMNWSQMESWQRAHPKAPPQGAGDAVKPVRIIAMCWQGGNGERPQDVSEVVNMSAEVVDGADTHLIGEIPERTNEPANNESYSCVFGMSQEITASDITLSTDSDLFWEGEEGTHTIATGDKIGYITEGTNDPGKGQVRVVGSSIRPSEHTGDENMQEWLSGRTDVDTNPNRLWPNFRKTVTQPERNRNPWQACVNDGICGIAGSN